MTAIPQKQSAVCSFAAVIGSVADGVFTVHQKWRITSFNRAAERITGIPAFDAIGKKCRDVFHADVCEQRCALQRTLESGRQIIDVPARILSNKGRSIPISLSTALLKDANGNLLGAVETFRDLSALEQLRREISQQYTFEDIVGKSKGMQRIFAILPDIAESDATVLIEGPSGSGKELLARAVHTFSLRRRKPLDVYSRFSTKCSRCAASCQLYESTGEDRDIPCHHSELLLRVYRRYFTRAGTYRLRRVLLQTHRQIGIHRQDKATPAVTEWAGY